MKSVHPLLLPLFLLLPLSLATSAHAATATPPNTSPTAPVLADLSRCDRTFFETLKRLAPEFAASPHFTSGRSFAFFKVADRSDPARSLQRFKTPLKLNQLEVVGYFDELMSLGDNSAFVAWGFLLRAPIKQVLAAIQSEVWDNNRLQPEGEVYARVEVWDQAHPEDGWQKIMTPGGAEVQADTVERELKIEPYEKDATLTRFGCSLQGAVSQDLLKQARPDIDSLSSH